MDPGEVGGSSFWHDGGGASPDAGKGAQETNCDTGKRANTSVLVAEKSVSELG
jgi:hypothetical protein